MIQRAISLKFQSCLFVALTLFLGACSQTSSEHQNTFNSAQYAPTAEVAIQSLKKGIQESDASLVTDTLRKLVDDRYISSSFDWVFFWTELSNLSDEELVTFLSFESDETATIKNVRDPKNPDSDQRIDVDVFRVLYQRHKKFESFGPYQKFMIKALQVAPQSKASEHILGLFDLTVTGQPIENKLSSSQFSNSTVDKLDLELLVLIAKKVGFEKGFQAADPQVTRWILNFLAFYTTQLSHYKAFNDKLGIGSDEWIALFATEESRRSTQEKTDPSFDAIKRKVFSSTFDMSKLSLAQMDQKNIRFTGGGLLSVDGLVNEFETMLSKGPTNKAVNVDALTKLAKDYLTAIDHFSNPHHKSSLDVFTKLLEVSDRVFLNNISEAKFAKIRSLVLENLTQRLFVLVSSDITFDEPYSDIGKLLLSFKPKTQLDPNLPIDKLGALTGHFWKLSKVHGLPTSLKNVSAVEGHRIANETISAYCTSFKELTGGTNSEKQLTVEGFQIPTEPGCYSLRDDIEFDSVSRSLVSKSLKQKPVYSFEDGKWVLKRFLELNLVKASENPNYFGMVLRTGGLAIKLSEGSEKTMLLVDTSYKENELRYATLPDDNFALPLFFEVEAIPKSNLPQGISYLGLAPFGETNAFQYSFNLDQFKKDHPSFKDPIALFQDYLKEGTARPVQFLMMFNGVFVSEQSHSPIGDFQAQTEIFDQVKLIGQLSPSEVVPPTPSLEWSIPVKDFKNYKFSQEIIIRDTSLDEQSNSIQQNLDLIKLAFGFSEKDNITEVDLDKMFTALQDNLNVGKDTSQIWSDFDLSLKKLSEVFEQARNDLGVSPAHLTSGESLFKMLDVLLNDPGLAPEGRTFLELGRGYLQAVVDIHEQLKQLQAKVYETSHRDVKWFASSQKQSELITLSQRVSELNLFLDASKNITIELSKSKGNLMTFGSRIADDPYFDELYRKFKMNDQHNIKAFSKVTDSLDALIVALQKNSSREIDLRRFYQPKFSWSSVQSFQERFEILYTLELGPVIAYHKHSNNIKRLRKDLLENARVNDKTSQVKSISIYNDRSNILHLEFLKNYISKRLGEKDSDVQMNLVPEKTLEFFLKNRDKYSQLSNDDRKNQEARELLSEKEETAFVAKLKQLVEKKEISKQVVKKLGELGETDETSNRKNSEYFDLNFKVAP